MRQFRPAPQLRLGITCVEITRRTVYPAGRAGFGIEGEKAVSHNHKRPLRDDDVAAGHIRTAPMQFGGHVHRQDVHLS